MIEKSLAVGERPESALRSRIGVAIVAVVALGFVLTTLANYWISRSSIRQAIVESDLPLTSDTLYSEIQQDLLRPTFVSSLMAQDTFLRDWVIEGEKDPSAITRYLGEIRRKYNAFTSFFVSDRTHVYYQSEGILKTVRADEPRDVWFFRVRNMAAPYETNVDPDMAHHDAITIFINYKVFDYDGRFIGAAGVGLQATAVKEMVERYQRQYHRVVTFVDPKGMLKLYSRDYDASEPDIHKRPGISAIADAILAQPQGRFEYSRDGSAIFVNSRFIPDLGWYLLVEQNADEALAVTRRALTLNLLFGVFATVVVAALCTALVRRSQKRLAALATTDALTGCFSRLAFEAILAQAYSRAQRSQHPVTLAFFDIDHFKSVNDRYGHAAGDVVLARVAERVRAVVRAGDALCRWGGEEFLLLLEDCGGQDAWNLVESARLAVEAGGFDFGGGRVDLTISVGTAELIAGGSGEDLIARADAALYRAKAEGRNRTVCDGE